MRHNPVKLLVTGGAGFIGANFVHYWLETYGRTGKIVVLDALTYAGNMENLADVMDNENLMFVHGDIRDYDLVCRLMLKQEISTIVHFAAESHVDRSIHGPDSFLETNITGTHTLLKAAKKVWLDEGSVKDYRFHHVSTDEVYGSLGPFDPPFRETDRYAPNSPYAASKASSDHLVRAYSRTYGLNVTTSNCSNNYGPYQFPEKLIPMLITNILQGRPLPVYGDGMQIRDWLHVDDHNRAIDYVLRMGIAGETYNIGGENEQPNMSIFSLVCRLVDARFKQNRKLAEIFKDAPPAQGAASEELIKHVSDRPGHDRRYAIDASKIRKKLGFQPEISFEKGMNSTVDWYLANRQWWLNVMDGSYMKWIEQNYTMRDV